MNEFNGNQSAIDQVCVKCRSCGLPWNRKLQRRKQLQRRKRAHLHFQLCSILIQSCVRRFLIQKYRRNNVPVEQWNRRCVHYLSRKGPYGARNHFAVYQRTICTDAAIEIQKVWRLRRCLKHLQRLSSTVREMKTATIQRVWRASWYRRSFRAVRRAIRQREERFYSLIDADDAADKDEQVCFCLSRGCPFAIEYKQPSVGTWKEVNRDKFRAYICQQLIVQHKRRKTSRIRRTTTFQSSTPRKSVADLKRDKIRKMSRNKWKWFYDKQDCCENNSALSRQLKLKVKVDDVSSDADVMAWVANLDLNVVA